MKVFGELEVGSHDLAWLLLLRLVEADQGRKKGMSICNTMLALGVDGS